MNRSRSNRRLTQLRRTLIAAGFAALLLAAPASAYDHQLSVSTSTTQAGGHPTLGFAVDFPSSPGATGLELTLPNGLVIAPAAITSPCSEAFARTGSCGQSARIGTAAIQSAGLGEGVGTVFLTSPISTGDVAGIAVKVQFTGGESAWMLASLEYTRGQSTSADQQIDFDEIPLAAASGAPLEMSALSISLDGSIGSPGNPLVTNPSSCGPETAIVVGSADFYDDSASLSSAEYPVTGCEQLPFEPVADWVFANPIAGQPTRAEIAVDLPMAQSSVEKLGFYMPSAIWLNTPAVGTLNDMCPPTSMNYDEISYFDSSECPDQAAVGEVALETPLLPAPIRGTLFVVDESPLFSLAIEFQDFSGAFNTGATHSWPKVVATCNPLLRSGCTTRMLIAIDSIPHLPITHFEMSIGKGGRIGASGSPLQENILRVASPTARDCIASGASKVRVTPRSIGIARDLNDQIAFSGCTQFVSPPNTTITSAPAGEISDPTPTIEFTSSSPGASFKCKIDGGAYQPCISPFTPSNPLANGAHRIRVRAVSNAGSDPTPAQVDFSVKTAPPPIPIPTIVTGPAQVTPDTSARFRFESEDGLSLECRLDSGEWEPCRSPLDFDGLEEGEHTFEVRHVAPEGQTAQSANWTWLIDFDANVCPAPQREPKILGGDAS